MLPEVAYGWRGASQSHRFSEVYFHAPSSSWSSSSKRLPSQSHRFSEVYFHKKCKFVYKVSRSDHGRNPIALVRSISTCSLVGDMEAGEEKSQSHRFSEVYFHMLASPKQTGINGIGRNPIALVRSISTLRDSSSGTRPSGGNGRNPIALVRSISTRQYEFPPILWTPS